MSKLSRRKLPVIIKFFTLLCFFSLIVFLIQPKPTRPVKAQGQTYYVTTSGNNSNPGTLEAPFATIGKALEAIQGGDTIWIRQGVYHEKLKIRSDKSGTASNRTYIKAYPGEQAVVDNSEPVDSWQQHSERIYKALVNYDVQAVIVDDHQLNPVSALEEVTGDTFYDGSGYLYTWFPGSKTPDQYEVGVIREESDHYQDVPIKSSANYITFDGLSTRYSQGIGFYIYYGESVQVLNSEVKFSKGTGVLFENTTNSEIKNCRIHHNMMGNWPTGVYYPTGGWGAGLAFASSKASGGITASSHNKVINTSSYLNNGEGIIALRSTGTLIQQNTVYDNWSVNIYIDNSADTIVNQNLVYVTRNEPFASLTRNTPSGIHSTNEDYGIGTNLNNLTVTNNVVIGCRRGFGFWIGETSGSGLKNSFIANNTFAHNRQAGIWVDRGNHSGTRFVNNIIRQKEGLVLEINDPNDTVFDYNNWYHQNATQVFKWAGTTYNYSAWKQSTGQASHSLWTDPLFVSNSGFNPDNYKVQSASPAIDAGTNIANITIDFWNTQRPQGAEFDIGAFEYTGGVQPSPSPTPTPSSTPTPTPSPSHCPPLGDIDCPGKVNGLDFGYLAAHWGTADPEANLDDIGVVDALDVLILLGNYKRSLP